RRSVVVIPEVVTNQLVVPDPLSRLCIETDEGGRIEVVAATMASVAVVGGAGRRQVHVSELRVGADGSPDVAAARVAPRAVLPRFDARLAFARNDVKRPQMLAGAHVVPPYVARRPFFLRRPILIGNRSADDDHVPD